MIAISAAVCRYRAEQGIDGPLFLGRDTHALSTPAARTIVEVLAAHGVRTVIDADDGATPPSDAQQWRDTATRHGGTWWEDWTRWAAESAGEMVDPPATGSDAHPVIGDAPGRYVHT